jgi:hypothetical protein
MLQGHVVLLTLHALEHFEELGIYSFGDMLKTSREGGGTATKTAQE